MLAIVLKTAMPGGPRVDETSCRLIERIQGTILDIVDPAMETEPFLRDAHGYRGMRADIIELCDNVGAYHAVDPRLFRWMVE